MDSITIKDLTYRYPISEKNALNHINLLVKKGEICSIIGANGSGKTTLCSAIRGFVPDFYKGDLDGEILIQGKKLSDMDMGNVAMEVGFVFQNPFTQISGIAKTVYDELAFGLENMGVEPQEIRRRVDEVLKLAKIEQFKDRDPFQLSGGQQQRIALAAILIMQQDILVIDEPTSQLDPQSTDDVFELIRLMKELGRTIVLVEHKMEQVIKYSDHIVVLDKGSIVMEGTPREIINNPDCQTYHTRLPQCTMAGFWLREKGIPLNQIPATKEEAINEITDYMDVTV